MSRLFTSTELAAAVAQSRRMVPVAVDALCEVIAEITGNPPDRRRVEYVSRFWLMHLCDRVVFDNPADDGVPGPHARQLKPDTPPMSAASRRRQLLSTIGATDAQVLVVDPYLKTNFAAEVLGALRLRRIARWGDIPRPIIDQGVGDRESLIGSGREDNIVRRLVALTAPLELVEHHHELSTWATENTRPHVKLVYTANAHQSSTAFRHWAFSQRQLGTKVAIHQHGGGYGIDETHFGEEHDIAVSDVFYTFGWSRPDIGSRVRSLPTAMPQRSKRSGTGELLLMSLPVTSRFYRLQPFLLPTHITRSVDETVEFADGLSASTKLRVRSSGNDRFPLERLAQSSAQIMEDTSGGRGSVAASRAKLVIHNYLGTSWLETLAMNIPTVCFYDPAMYRPRAAAQPFIDALARVGVIHYSGKEAAKFVNSLRSEPSTWWKSAEVQEAREAFVARYANFSDNWLEAWQEEFESLLAE